MKEAIKQLQEKAREEFNKEFGSLVIFDIKKSHHYGLLRDYPVFDEILKHQDTLVEQTYKQGRIDMKRDIEEAGLY